MVCLSASLMQNGAFFKNKQVKNVSGSHGNQATDTGEIK